MSKLYIINQEQIDALLKGQRLNCSAAYEMPQDISKPMRYCIENAESPTLPLPVECNSQSAKEFLRRKGYFDTLDSGNGEVTILTESFKRSELIDLLTEYLSINKPSEATREEAATMIHESINGSEHVGYLAKKSCYDAIDALILAGFINKTNEGKEEIMQQVIDELINTPHSKDFIEAIKFEMAHHKQKWGDESHKPFLHFANVLQYLLGKMIKCYWDGDAVKTEHHITTIAAVAGTAHEYFCKGNGITEFKGTCTEENKPI